jgi:hypothetical protein
MDMQEDIVNRVANSGLETFNLEDYYPEGERVLLDIKDQLFQGMILREKDFRAFLKEHDWSIYEGKSVAITCSEDAIIPTWAYMLLSIKLKTAKKTVYGSLDDLEQALYQEVLRSIDFSKFEGKRVVIKGCSDESIPEQVYVEATQMLLPYAASIMFGEPCSTVPLYKKPKR